MVKICDQCDDPAQCRDEIGLCLRARMEVEFGKNVNDGLSEIQEFSELKESDTDAYLDIFEQDVVN